MKTIKEIDQNISNINKQIKELTKKKRLAKSESANMRIIDNRLEKLYSQRNALEWVVD